MTYLPPKAQTLPLPTAVLPTVLLIEGDDLVAELLTECFAERGINLLRAESGGSASALLSSVDVALFDCSPFSPSVGPLVEEADRLGLPVILMTTNIGQTLCNRLHDKPVLSKPFQLAKLLHVVSREISHSRCSHPS
jgi:DNA-binding NtrC family response regulator